MARRQGKLPGIAVEIPEIEKAADEYVEARDRRMERTKDEVLARDRLIEAMTTARKTFYRTVGGLECAITAHRKVKVSRANGEAADGEDPKAG